MEQNTIVSVTTPTHAVSVDLLNCSGLRETWTPGAEADPTQLSSIVIAKFADGDGCHAGIASSAIRTLARVFYRDPSSDLSGTAVLVGGYAVSGPVFALVSGGAVALSAVNFTLDMAGTVGADNFDGSFICAQYSLVSSGWTSSGCLRLQDDSSAAGFIVACHCEILSAARTRRAFGSGGSYFTVLVGDTTARADGSPAEEFHAEGILWVTYIGLAVSVPSMLAFVYLYMRHQELRTPHRFNVANLCAVLAVAMVLFVFGINGDAGTPVCSAGLATLVSTTTTTTTATVRPESWPFFFSLSTSARPCPHGSCVLLSNALNDFAISC